ncbi:MAG: alpha/beta hydrolase [Nitrososphaerota archaeon]|nr:alpha/beta hydrolase [Nitrososphaerota archaeon]
MSVLIYRSKHGVSKRGWVVLVHGLGEYSGRAGYQRFIELLNDNGFAVYAFDLPGHGRSSGKRGHTTIEEIMKIIDDIVNDIGEKPYLFGHSLGGLTVLRYGEVYPDKIRGLIVSSPALTLGVKLSRAQTLMLRILKIIAPSTTVNNRIDPMKLSRSREAVERYITDKLIHMRVSIALIDSMIDNIRKVYEEADKIKVPVLMLIGTSDVITLPIGAKALYEKLKVSDKTLKEFPEAYHEIFEDPEWSNEFYETIVGWLLKQSV